MKLAVVQPINTLSHQALHSLCPAPLSYLRKCPTGAVVLLKFAACLRYDSVALVRCKGCTAPLQLTID